MSCENCGRAQLPGALYCIHCGHPFPGECPECGFANPPDARFCGGCRRSLSGGAVDTEGERRPLTFLFCDLVDSTALFEQLDPEDVRQVQNAVRRLFSKLAAMHDGYVAEYVGDGVVLYFGYPQAQENDPERAVRCGLAMARQVGSVRRTLRLSAPLAVRVAIHTDQATLGPVSPDDDRHWAAYGVATSITGRLQKNAPPGGVVVTDATWELTRGCFTGRSLGRVALDGVSQQITAWQVESEVPAHDWDDERHTAALFVGREREQHLVDELWRAAIVGETHFALLRGEPGMGKSRLARHWCDVVGPTGANVVVARATSNGRNHPFHPIVALLEKTFGLGHGSTDERLSRLAAGLRAIGVDDAVAVPFLAPLLGVLPGEYSATADLSPARRRIRSIEVLTEVLAALCAEPPTLLIVEDLHWADESTVELLARVVKTFPALGLLGIFTSRPEFDGDLGSRLPTADHPPRPARRRRAGGNRPGGGARQGAARSRPPADPGPLRRSAAVRRGAHPVHVRVRDAAGVVGILGDRGRPVGGPHPHGRPRTAHGARRPARCGTLDGPDRSHDRPRVQRGAVARGQRARRRDAGRGAAATHRSGSDLANCRCRGHVRLQTLAVARRRLRAAVAAPQAGLPQPDRRGAPRPVGPPRPLAATTSSRYT